MNLYSREEQKIHWCVHCLGQSGTYDRRYIFDRYCKGIPPQVSCASVQYGWWMRLTRRLQGFRGRYQRRSEKNSCITPSNCYFSFMFYICFIPLHCTVCFAIARVSTGPGKVLLRVFSKMFPISRVAHCCDAPHALSSIIVVFKFRWYALVSREFKRTPS